jgi:hypothetical protein
METHINTYGGLNKDTAYDSIPNSLYIDALDIRITTTTGESMGAFTNIKGNEFSFAFPTSGENFGGWEVTGISEIIGYTTIRNKIILFVTDDNTDNPGWIYEVLYNPDTRQLNTLTLKYYNPFFNFSKLNPIEALGRYESPSIQRVYWTDYNNFFRSINLESPTLSTTPLELIDIYPDITFQQPLLQTVSGGGNLLTGVYQFAYRLITFDGKETLISPPSNLIHVVTNSELTGSADYNGDPIPVNSGKSLTITVDTTDYSNFKTIEFVSIYHSSSTAIPEVKVVEQVAVNNQSTVTLVYTSNEGTSYPIELLEFTQRNYAFKTCKTLTQKDNSLVIANIKSSKISVESLLEEGEEFSALTARYNSAGETFYPLDTNSNKLLNAFNQELNKDAHWDSDWQTDGQYKYQSDSLRLGGEGPNISYNFHLEPFTVDADVQAGFANVSYLPTFYGYDSHDLNDGYGVRANTTFPNSASPYISGLLRGYKRGETYRFGVVFYTTKGESTFVEYIGDIKFPDISEEDRVNNLSNTLYFPLSQANPDNTQVTIAYNLGIQFELDFSSCPSLLDKVSSYQIVRVKREDVDRRRLSQGVLKVFRNYQIGAGSSRFDLRVDGSTDVVHIKHEQLFDNFGEVDSISTPAHVAFYSPEISFNHLNTIQSVKSGSAGLLVTGGYTIQDLVADSTTSDKSPIDLGKTTVDFRLKLKNTIPSTFNDIENIKRWENSSYFNMLDNSTYQDKVTPMFNGFYMRNYWAYNEGGDLNNPRNQNSITPGYSYFSRSGSNIIGNTAKYTVDPITQQSVPTISPYNFLRPGSITFLDGFGTDEVFPIVDLIQARAEVYGGYSTSALEANVFIPASPVINITNLNPIVFGGDIFMNMFTLQTAMTDFNTDLYKVSLVSEPYFQGTYVRTELIVTESLINQDLAYGATLRTLVQYKFDGDESPVLRQENNNTVAPTAKSFNMYAYNTVDSRENSDVTFFVKPLNSEESDTNDIRAYLSNVKINGENIDSWAKFGVNNFYDIDDYGPINKILNWRDNVFFIQDRSIGIYAINRSAITTTADGVPTQLGTGLGFGKHQYISKEHGSIHQWGIKATEGGIYFFDALHRKIFISAGDAQPLSEAKGIHSLLQALPPNVFLRKENLGDNPILGKGIHIGKDAINDEVIFTFLSKAATRELTINTTYVIGNIVYYNYNYYFITNQFTTGTNGIINVGRLLGNSRLATAQELYNSTSIVYDELAQQFSSRYSATPKMWIDNGDTLLSANPLLNSDVYVHNIGEWGNFYDNQVECSIQLVLNPQADINKVLRTLEFNSIVRDNDKVIDRESTITAFRIQTQYQDTLKVPFSADRIKRRFDKWRVKIPRDQTSTIRQGRLRSTYFIVTLYFDNSSNKEIIMNRLLSYFDYQVF